MTATEVAYAMAATTQGVLAVVWLLGSRLAGDMRRAAALWAAYAAMSAASFAFLTLALRASSPAQAEQLRAVGNLLGIVAFVVLQRGIWHFIGREPRALAHLFAISAGLVASYVGLSPAAGAFRVSVNSTVLALLALSMARDLHRHARDRLHLGHPWLIATPLLAAAAGLAFRAVRAAFRPDVVALQMIVDSGLNVASAFAYIVIALAFHAALMALVVGRLLTELRHRSRHDGLTGLMNRRAIEELLQQQLLRSRRTGEAFCILLLDLDHFKAINDRFGHAAGDRALKQAAATLKAGLREVDSLARFGGEEFLALLPGASVETSRPVAERLRADLNARPMLHQGAEVALTASIGLAQCVDAASDASALIARADAALYQAKVRGRNRVVVAAPTE